MNDTPSLVERLREGYRTHRAFDGRVTLPEGLFNDTVEEIETLGNAIRRRQDRIRELEAERNEWKSSAEAISILCDAVRTTTIEECLSAAQAAAGYYSAIEAIRALPRSATVQPRPLDEWDEAMGDVLWWFFPIKEPPYVGTPNDLGRAIEVTIRDAVRDYTYTQHFGGWPGYHTHFTPLPVLPVLPAEEKPQEKGQ